MSDDWPGFGPHATAVMYVLDSTGEAAGTQRGMLSHRPEVIERLWSRVGLPVPDGPAVFVDRFGQMHLSWQDVEQFARGFAETEPETVVRAIDLEERKLAGAGAEPGARLEGWIDKPPG